MDLLQQAVAMMIVGMAIVFAMLIALIGVTVANARVVQRFKLEPPPPPPKPARPKAAASTSTPIVAIIAAAIEAHESN